MLNYFSRERQTPTLPLGQGVLRENGFGKGGLWQKLQLVPIQQPRQSGPRHAGAGARCQPTDGEVRLRGESMKKDCSSVGGPWPFDLWDVPDVPKWHVSSNKLHSQTGGRGLQITVRSEGICCDDPGLDGAYQRSPSRTIWQSTPAIANPGVVTSSRVTAAQSGVTSLTEMWLFMLVLRVASLAGVSSPAKTEAQTQTIWEQLA